MKNIVKPHKEDEDADAGAFYLFSQLPEEMILEILNKLLDLKTLCRCYLVSKRLSSIVLRVNAISYSAPPLIPYENTVIDLCRNLPLPPELFSFYGESFPSAIRFMTKFKELKSLCIELPSSSEIGIATNCLFKWKVKFGNRIESFLFLMIDSICAKDGSHLDGIRDEEDNGDLAYQKYMTLYQCMKDVIVRHMMLLYLIKDLPKLEEVSITDKERRGKLSMSGGKQISEVKEWVHNSASEALFKHVEYPERVLQLYIHLMSLPVSEHVLNGAFCVLMENDGAQGGNDGVMNSEIGFEGKEGALYAEALMEILDKYSD